MGLMNIWSDYYEGRHEQTTDCVYVGIPVIMFGGCVRVWRRFDQYVSIDKISTKVSVEKTVLIVNLFEQCKVSLKMKREICKTQILNVCTLTYYAF